MIINDIENIVLSDDCLAELEPNTIPDIPQVDYELSDDISLVMCE